jgi:hypothetical protein
MAKTTHIICILDRSGSMSRQADEVISNFNTFLKEQQSLEGKAKLTLVLFDDEYDVVYDQLNIKKVPPLTSGTYFTRGMTAMNDAIGKTLNTLQRKKKAIVLVHTDGYENASQEYTYATVKTLVDKLKKKWEFIFVGGDINAREMGSNLGIVRTANVSNSAYGTQNTYANFSATTSAYRDGGLAASAAVNLVEDGQYVDGDITKTNNVSDIINTPNVFGGPLTNDFKGLSEEDLARIKEALESKDD